jgi:CheY-like chemotaxis protein
MHDGQIEAKSDGPDQGSTFIVRLPALQSTEAVEAPARASVPSRISRRVLIIDDNEDAVTMLAAFVATLGCEVQTAFGGEQGLKRATPFQPDVILLDVGMPGMDGYETCRRLREVSAGRSAYIVALTGWGQDEDRARALESGFDAHVTKPADPRILEDLLLEKKAASTRSPAVPEASG